MTTKMKGSDETSPDTRTLRERYDEVRARIAAAADKSGRRASDIVLVAVTKYASIEDIRELVSLGHADLGENRVQQLVQRAAIIEEFNGRRSERYLLTLTLLPRRSGLLEVPPIPFGDSSTPPLRLTGSWPHERFDHPPRCRTSPRHIGSPRLA